tara:strand:- start:57 stop:338 length:282 start_codon:yes stop_codon:yes gene_type:complete
MNSPFKMNGFSGFGNSPMKQSTIFGKKTSDIKKELKVKADQIPFVGPSTSAYSTVYKAAYPKRFPKATINQKGYEKIREKKLKESKYFKPKSK